MKIGEFSVGEIVAKYGSPLFVYDQQVIENRCKQLLNALKILPTKTKSLYACKANTNLQILKLIKENGIEGIDAVSLQEVQLAKRAGFEAKNIQFTENFIGWSELEASLDEGILLCIGELDTLEQLGKRLRAENELNVRENK